MYSVLNILSEYSYFYISKNITSYTFLFVFKIVESPQYILKKLDIQVLIWPENFHSSKNLKQKFSVNTICWLSL